MDIKTYVAFRKEELKKYIGGLEKKPHLVIIQANNNPSSDAYVRGKIRDAEEIGAKAILVKLDPSTSQADILATVEKYNKQDDVDGIIVQLPLEKHVDENAVKNAVCPEKDVDGFHPLTTFIPCTPKGIFDYLSEEGFQFEGANAVVLGRSNIVGKPMAKLLLSKNCNVTVLHSKTKPEDREYYVAHADIIVVAIGKLGYLNSSFTFKNSAVVIDVGINRGDDGKLHGDATPNLPVALQTPVPGGVGLLTRIALMCNLLEAYKNRNK